MDNKDIQVLQKLVHYIDSIYNINPLKTGKEVWNGKVHDGLRPL